MVMSYRTRSWMFLFLFALLLSFSLVTTHTYVRVNEVNDLGSEESLFFQNSLWNYYHECALLINTASNAKISSLFSLIHQRSPMYKSLCFYRPPPASPFLFSRSCQQQCGWILKGKRSYKGCPKEASLTSKPQIRGGEDEEDNTSGWLIGHAYQWVTQAYYPPEEM